MSHTTTILLAAGLSRRMGAMNKLLLPVYGKPMIAHMVQTYQAATSGPVLVVTGHDSLAIEEALRGTGAEIVLNADYFDGQSTSVACGLREMEFLHGGRDNLLIGLGDQPLLRPEDLVTLLAAHAAHGADKISIPRWGEARGNPIVVPPSLRSHLLADPKAPGCRNFTRKHAEHVAFHALPSAGFYQDIDTPEDFAAFTDARMLA